MSVPVRNKKDDNGRHTLEFKQRDEPRRVSFLVPPRVHADLQEFAELHHETMTGVIRWSLAVGKALADEVSEGNKVKIYSKDDDFLKELVIRVP